MANIEYDVEVVVQEQNPDLLDRELRDGEGVWDQDERRGG